MDNENKVDDISKFLDMILSGDYDDHLFIINETVSTRKSSLATRVVSKLSTGDIVQLSNIKPKYLSGLKAEVLSTSNGKITAKIEDTYIASRYRNRIVTISKEMIKL